MASSKGAMKRTKAGRCQRAPRLGPGGAFGDASVLRHPQRAATRPQVLTGSLHVRRGRRLSAPPAGRSARPGSSPQGAARVRGPRVPVPKRTRADNQGCAGRKVAARPRRGRRGWRAVSGSPNAATASARRHAPRECARSRAASSRARIAVDSLGSEPVASRTGTSYCASGNRRSTRATTSARSVRRSATRHRLRASARSRCRRSSQRRACAFCL